jgi:hypothetical protein
MIVTAQNETDIPPEVNPERQGHRLAALLQLWICEDDGYDEEVQQALNAQGGIAPFEVRTTSDAPAD